MRAAIYARISSDRSGDHAGTERQIADSQALADRHGWTVVGTYVDNDVSAYSGRQRPQFQALLGSIQNGSVDVVVAYHVDRLYRRMRDLVPLLELCEKTGATVATVQAGSLDLATASGRVVASILGAVAEGESARQAERIRRQKLDRALAGKPNGSMRSFGYAADGSVVESEATVIRDIAARVLAGESLRSITAELNDGKVPTVRGGLWRHTTIRQLLMAARLSGQREHMPAAKGRGRSNGPIVAVGDWEPILSVDDTARLRQVLGDPARRTIRPGQQLLTGVLRCGNCGNGMNSHSDTKGGRRYVCIRQPGTSRCGTRSVVGPESDEFAIEVFLEATYGQGPPSRLIRQPAAGVPEQAQAEADKLTRELKQLAVQYASDEITETDYERRQSELKERRTRVLSTSAGVDPSVALAALPDTQGEFRERFDSFSVDRRRAILSAVIESIELGPVARRGRSTFDVGRFQIIWRA